MRETHSCFFPVFGLDIHQDIRGEIGIERVVFISARKLPYVRKRLGIPEPISHYRQQPFRHGSFFREAKTYAWLRSRRSTEDRGVSQERAVVQDALWLLASSAHGRCERGRYDLSLSPPPANRLYETSLVFGPSSSDSYIRNERVVPIENYPLNRAWKGYLANHHFAALLRLLNGRTDCDKDWRYTIRTSAILAGRSYLSKHLYDAFILNMIAIEALLARRGEKFPQVLIDRVSAFFGWLAHDRELAWRDTIERLYKLRCSYVHDGQAGEIGLSDLDASDNLLANLLLNICRNVETFSSTDAIADFSERLDARRRLGLKLRTRQPRLQFVNRSLTPARKKRLAKRFNCSDH